MKKHLWFVALWVFLIAAHLTPYTQPIELAAVDPKQFFMPIDMTNHKVINLATPTADGDAVRKDFSQNASNLASGTVATARLGSGTASSSTYLRGDQTWASVSAARWYTLTDGATVTATWTDGATNSVTLGGDRTLAISGSPALGERITLRFKQDGTGGRTITWPTSGVTIQWPYNDEIVLTTTASAVDQFELLCVDATGGALVFEVANAFLNLQ